MEEKREENLQPEVALTSPIGSMIDPPGPVTDDVTVGSIWKENDSRFSRYITVLEVHPLEGKAVIATIRYPIDESGVIQFVGRKSVAKLSRFNKRKGYHRVEV